MPPPAAEIHDRYDTVWNRLGAFVVDSVLLSPVWLIGPLCYRQIVGQAVGSVWNLTSLLLCTAYYVHFHGHSGQTPGKRLLRVRVVTAGGEQPIGYVTAAMRELPWVAIALLGVVITDLVRDPRLVRTFPILESLVAGGNALLIVLTARHRGFDDALAGTVVVRTSAASVAATPVATTSPAERFERSLYCPAGRSRRALATMFNALLFAGIPPAGQILAGGVLSTGSPAVQVLLSGSLLMMLWLFTVSVGSSPGGLFCKLVIRHREDRPVRWPTHVLRTLPHLLLGVSVLPKPLVSPELKTAHAAVFLVIALPMALNAIAFATRGVSLVDRGLQLSWWRLNLPPDLSRRR